MNRSESMKPDYIRISFKLTDLMAVTAIVAVCAAMWKFDFGLGWMATIIGVTASLYFINHLRARPPFLASMIVAIPLIALAFFFVALLFGLHHPPFMIPPDWKQPLFTSIEERMIHAFALSIWVWIFSTWTILILSMIRRTLLTYGQIGPLEYSLNRLSHHNDASVDMSNNQSASTIENMYGNQKNVASEVE